MKDYEVTIKFRNNYMITAMRRCGYETAADLSRATGVTQSVIGKYLNLKRCPYNRWGKVNGAIDRISKALKCLPEDIFPPKHIEKTLEKNTTKIEVSLEDVANILDETRNLDPSKLVEFKERVHVVDNALSDLTEREEDVVRCFAQDEKTFTELAEMWGVTPQRISQIYNKSIKKIRNNKFVRYYEEL